MATLHFQQITDDRFEDDILNKLIARNETLKNLLNVKGIEALKIGEPRLVTFEEGKQYRSDYYLIKNKKITWNEIYGIVNSVCAVPFKLI